MKVDFYSEAITKDFERFTVIGCQINKVHPDMGGGNENYGRYYISFWLLGFGIIIVF